jgi:hypothetical protein
MLLSSSKNLWQTLLWLDNQSHKKDLAIHLVSTVRSPSPFYHRPDLPPTPQMAFSFPNTSFTIFPILTHPVDTVSSNMEISPPPTLISYMPLTLPSTPNLTPEPSPSLKPRPSGPTPRVAMMKTGGCRPRPQLAHCAKGSPKHSLTQKVATQVAMVTQASCILGSPISSTLQQFTRQNPLIRRDGNEVYAVNAQSPISRNLRARPNPYPRGILHTKEEYLFFPNEPFTMLVNEAIDLERDETLWAEVSQY